MEILAAAAREVFEKIASRVQHASFHGFHYEPAHRNDILGGIATFFEGIVTSRRADAKPVAELRARRGACWLEIANPV